MIDGARRFQPRTSVRSGCGALGEAWRRTDSSTTTAGSADRWIRSSSAAITISRSPVPSTVVEGGLRRGVPPAGSSPMTDASANAARLSPKVLPDQRRLLREVDLVAGEVEQLGVDHRQPGLAAGLRGDPRDDLLRQDQLDLVASDHAGHVDVGPVADLGHDVVRLGPSVGVVGDGQDRLDHVGVGLFALGRQDDDRPGRGQAGDAQVVDVHRAARAAHDLGPTGRPDPGPDLVLHLDLVAVGQDDDARPPLVLVGRDDLGDHRVDLLRPAEDHRVLALDDPRAALAQLRQLALEAGVEDADQGADDEDPAEGDDEHREQEAGRPLVAAHRPGIERQGAP